MIKKKENNLLDQALREEIELTKRLYFNCFGDEDYVLEEGLERWRNKRDDSTNES